MKMVSKALALALALSFTVSSTALPRRAEAAWGLAFGVSGIVLAAVGGVAIAVGIPGLVVGLSEGRRDMTGAMAATLFLGVVFLENEQGQQAFGFTEVSEERAAQAQMTAEELESFNSEYDLLNAVHQQVQADLSVLASKGVVGDALTQASARMWNESFELVSPLTRSGARKLMQLSAARR